MLYIIGLGLNYDGISKYGLLMTKKCKRVYIDNYTVDFPYSMKQLEEVVGKKIIPADREKIENLSLIDESDKMDVALLVYGSPLTATTHITLIQEAKKSNVKYKIIYNASILDAVAETGLQLYKFGKITSMPEFKADSFIDIIKDNQKINAHSLILVDIGFPFNKALEKLKKSADKKNISLSKILICSKLGCKGSRIFYRDINEIKPESRVEPPYCFIIPGKLHFLENEMLESF